MIVPTSFAEISSKLRSGELTTKKLVQHYIANINSFNSSRNAFLEVFEEEALSKAVQVDQKLQNGSAGRLAGMVVGIKDLFAYENHNLSCSSRILQGFESQITATVLQKLLDEDAIIIGRQNCDEFGMGSSNENSAFGPVRNHDDLNKVPGGSSGGSAVAIQADMCTLSVASDTGGSIRQPAAFTGTIGIKPTYGRISRYGLTAYSSSFDCVGFISKSIEDLELVLEICSGEDRLDSTSSTANNFKPHMETLSDVKAAVFTDLVEAEGVSKEIRSDFKEIVSALENAGDVDVDQLEFPYTEFLLPIYYILTSAEASTNLSRYDGVRYGYRADHFSDIESLYKMTRHNGFGREVIRRILLGTFVLSANYHDAFYVKALRARSLIRNFLKSVFRDYDFVLLPTTPTPAFDLGAKTADPVEMYVSDIFTTLASIGGFPAISIPVDLEGQRSGNVQIISDDFREPELLMFSKQIKSL